MKGPGACLWLGCLAVVLVLAYLALWAHDPRLSLSGVFSTEQPGLNEPRLICFSRGHAEHGLTDSGPAGLSGLRATLSQAGYDLRELDLALETVPHTAAALVICGPRQSLDQACLHNLQNFLAQGGAVLIALDPGFDAGLTALLAARGIACPDNLVIDPASRSYGGGDTVPMVSRYAGLPNLADFHYASFFPQARAFELAARPGLNPLALSGISSWAESDRHSYELKGRASRSASEPQGPLVLAALARFDQARLIVFGDSDFMTNAHLNNSGNGLLVLSCLEGLSAELSGSPSFPVLSRPQVYLIFGLGVVLLPALGLAGLVVVLVLRRRA